MLGIQIDTEFLELAPDAALEMERSNPFLQFNETITGEYSLPLSVTLSPNNLKLLKYAGLLQVRPDAKGVDAICWDDGLQHSSGKLKVEKIDHNLNRTAAGTASLYYLTGISAFYQDAKNVKLRACNFGGDRSFAWDGFNRNGNGFWAHIHAVLDAAPTSFDYAFYPVINKAWAWEKGRTEVMNWIDYSGIVNFNIKSTDESETNVIVPFPYLKYVLDHMLAQIGWRAEGAIVSDPDFAKITMLNFKAIEWAKPYLVRKVVERSGADAVPGTVTFNLRDHLPDVTVVDFLIALKNRFGWRYDFDARKKILHIDDLDSLVGTVQKDYTAYASPLVSKKVLADKKNYSLKNNFSGEYAATPPEFPEGSVKGEVTTRAELPLAAVGIVSSIYLVRTENSYYICRQNPDDESCYWEIYSYNIYDVVPEGATDDITTAATTVGSERYDGYLSLAPRFDQNGIWWLRNEQDVTWGIHLLFYHGHQLNEANQYYPFASHHIFNYHGVQVGNWSLAFEGKNRDGENVGLYDRKWKTFLDAIGTGEEFELTLYLPRTEYMKLRFSDTLVIRHVRIFIKKIRHTVPYKNQVTLECSRI